ncbi:MAG: glutamate racemase [Gammaproteobacteria bacterium]|nr:glutamate racemase [Gammaproteobacteria bacterium]
MKKSPIGVFDSGVGGLSVLQEIQRTLPNEDVIYIADSAYAPYGNKDIDFVLQRCHNLTAFLIAQGAKAIVVACNTATAAAIQQLRDDFSVPVIGMEPGVKPAIAATQTKTVGVLATENTLLSQQFGNLLHRYAKDVKVISQPCPGLVEQIEAGLFDNERTNALIRQYVQPLLDANADTIVLGCTHYPLIKKQIAAIAGNTVSLIETGSAVALQLQRQLQQQDLLSESDNNGLKQFYTSGDTDQIGRVIATIIDSTIKAANLPDELL